MLNHSKSTHSSCSSTKSNHSFWIRFGKLFRKSKSSSTCNSSTSSTISHTTDDFDPQKKQRKQLIHNEEPSSFIIPPFSPTYLKSNEFPYSNFYVKLPDGRWMVRYRDGNRDILRTDFVDGYLI